MMAISETACAKINLALHVVGQREDGYHCLDSLVVFAQYGDEIKITLAPERAAGDHFLKITGPFSKGLATNADNLVLKALDRFEKKLPALDITLCKNLPVASGIGGGSADAAATIRATCRLLDLPSLPTDEAILSLGADVPVCIGQNHCRMEGIGDILSPIPPLPEAALVLVNPAVAVSTPAIFKTLLQKNNAPLPAFPKTGFSTFETFSAYLKETRNDLQPPAETLAPQITDALALLRQTDNTATIRMSGSGATCFSLTQTMAKAEKIAKAVQKARPDWWVRATRLNS